MPQFSQGSRSTLSYIEEVTFGTTPAGNFTNIPFSTHSLNLTKERVQGTDIQSDRMPRVDRHGNRTVGGDIVVDLRDSDYDDLLASAMLSDWSSNVLKVGTTPKYFSIEDYAADIDRARLFTGCTVSTLGVSIAPNQMITTTFTMVGQDMASSQTEKTQNVASGAAPFDSYSGDLEIGLSGGVPWTTAIVTQLDFTLTNSFSPTFVIGSDITPTLQYGQAVVEGTLTAYQSDTEPFTDWFLDEDEVYLSVSVNDPTGLNQYTFEFPRIKVNGASIPVGGPESRMVEVPFIALYDSTEDTNLSITRTA